MLIYVSGVNYNVNSNYTKYLAQLCCRFFLRFGKFPPQNEYRNGNDNVLLTLQSVTMIVTSLSSSTTREVYQMPKAEKPTGIWYWTSSRKLFAPLPLDRVTQESPSSTSVYRQFVAFVEGEICASVTARLFVCMSVCSITEKLWADLVVGSLWAYLETRSTRKAPAKEGHYLYVNINDEQQ